MNKLVYDQHFLQHLSRRKYFLRRLYISQVNLQLYMKGVAKNVGHIMFMLKQTYPTNEKKITLFGNPKRGSLFIFRSTHEKSDISTSLLYPKRKKDKNNSITGQNEKACIMNRIYIFLHIEESLLLKKYRRLSCQNAS